MEVIARTDETHEETRSFAIPSPDFPKTCRLEILPLSRRVSNRGVCSGSSYPSEAMRWMKEVETATFVDDFTTSRSILGNQFPDFEMLDARIVSSLQKIILNSIFKKRVHPDTSFSPPGTFPASLPWTPLTSAFPLCV